MKDETIKILKDTIIQWKKEYDILDSIIDLKDAVIKDLREDINDYVKGSKCAWKSFENEFCPEAEHKIKCLEKGINFYKQTLEEIKKIMEDACYDTCPDLKNGYCIGLSECALRAKKQILEIIKKAEVEDEH